MSERTHAEVGVTGTGPAGVRVRWLRRSDRDAAEAVWTNLEAELSSDDLACSWAWTETWLASYGDAVDHRFVVGEQDDGPGGIALVCAGTGRRRGPFRLKSLHLGTAGEPPGSGVFVEYNRVLVRPAQRDAFAAALMGLLRDDASWHELALDGFAPEDAEPLLRAEPGFITRSEPSPVLTLAALGEGGAVGAVKSGTRRKVRRSMEALGDLSTEWASTSDHALDILQELIELHQSRWRAAGKPGAFSDQRFIRFHSELIPRLLPERRVILFRVRAGSGTVGCLYHFVERKRALFYQSGFAVHEDRRITPGFVAFVLCMDECAKEGLVEYDFLAGDDRYKRDLATTTRELVWATLRRPALRWRLLDAAATMRERRRERHE